MGSMDVQPGSSVAYDTNVLYTFTFTIQKYIPKTGLIEVSLPNDVTITNTGAATTNCKNVSGLETASLDCTVTA